MTALKYTISLATFIGVVFLLQNSLKADIVDGRNPFLMELLYLAGHNDLFDRDHTNKMLGLIPVLGSDGKQVYTETIEPPQSMNSSAKIVDGCIMDIWRKRGSSWCTVKTQTWTYKDPEKSIFKDHPKAFEKLKFTYTFHNPRDLMIREGNNVSFTNIHGFMIAEIQMNNIDEYRCIKGNEVFSVFGRFGRYYSDYPYGQPPAEHWRTIQIAENNAAVTDIVIDGPMDSDQSGCVQNITIRTYKINTPKGEDVAFPHQPFPPISPPPSLPPTPAIRTGGGR